MVFLIHNSAAQIITLLVISGIFQILIIIASPISDVLDKRITLLIEASVSIYLYALLSISDVVGVNNLREEIGWLLVILIGTIVAIIVIVFFCRCIRRAFMFIKPRVMNCLFK
jgi:hypothetical protein